MEQKLNNKISIITGAASGIGRAIARAFVRHGAPVVLVDMNKMGLLELQSELEKNGGQVLIYEGDVSDHQVVEYIVGSTHRHFGVIDNVINNAGILDDFSAVGEMDLELYERVSGTNLSSAVYFSKFTIPLMLKEGRGNILNICSLGGFMGCRAGAAYTISKHAMIGLTKNTAYMYAQRGIRCNAIGPGGIRTNIASDIQTDEFGYSRCSTGFPTMIRTGEPEEIAEIAVFLSSESSGLINGAVITADAGWSAY